MNQVNLVGVITQDIVLKESERHTKYIQFSLAIKSNRRQGTSTDFIDIVAFAKQAEILADYAKKGTKIALSGRLASNQFVNKDGVQVSKVNVILERFEFLSHYPRKKVEEEVAVTAL